MEPIQSLSDLLSEHSGNGTFIEIHAQLSRTFGQTTLSATVAMNKLFSIYEVDLEVQRQLIPKNVSQLVDYLLLYLEHGQSIYFPGIILSARGAGQFSQETSAFRLQPMEKCYVVDGQHRLEAFRRVMEMLQSNLARAKDRREFERVQEITDKLKKLYAFPMSVMIYCDINPKQERQLFSDINKLPRKIAGNLAMLREQRRFYHVMATRLVQEYPVMKHLPTDIYSERGKSPGYLFSYSLLIELLVGLFEGRLKVNARHNGYHFTAFALNEHLEQAANYFENLLHVLPEPEPGHICWSENIQIALALFLHEEAFKSQQFNKYTLQYATKILPHIQWEHIYKDDEQTRLPRRSRIMKAYQSIKDFYAEQHHLLISDKEDAG
ncbi:DNA sulfur modification protein DndB [Paenibacillus methanolicus]|uniref:DGQHR domain-containing protein n=1 Tax=Paenibacillus methanolicus TaxID=582686 RepID=A0A5S5CBG1_9BACL|nr:DNA sulfur modification protein DndB [Paenibacillus methanolicus]TYP76715.1 DGQHR domain-containing protein [Paenibacillus methanolicus]